MLRFLEKVANAFGSALVGIQLLHRQEASDILKCNIHIRSANVDARMLGCCHSCNLNFRSGKHHKGFKIIQIGNEPATQQESKQASRLTKELPNEPSKTHPKHHSFFFMFLRKIFFYILLSPLKKIKRPFFKRPPFKRPFKPPKGAMLFGVFFAKLKQEAWHLWV